MRCTRFCLTVSRVRQWRGFCVRRARDSHSHRVHCPFATVFTFDFSGSGASQGEYVSLGHFEKVCRRSQCLSKWRPLTITSQDDVACVVEHLRASGTVTTVGMWGRSMGAATALLYSHMDPSIAGMLLDSPYR